MAKSKGFAVILRTFILVAIIILVSLFFIFLAVMFIPALKKQTNIDDEMLLSKTEHKFEKLEDNSDFSKYNKKAIILCNCEKKFKNDFGLSARKGQSCAAISLIYGSLNDCKFSCIGLGDCTKVCEQEAISINNNTAVINELCNGCGKCVSVCPKNVISLIPIGTNETVLCKNEIQTLTTCNSLKKVSSVIYPEKKGFKIWKICYKILNNSL